MHSLRSDYTDWAVERTNSPKELAAKGIAHNKIPESVEPAYLRIDFFEKRRQLLDEWAHLLEAAPSVAA